MPGTWYLYEYPGTVYCCVCVLYFKAPHFSWLLLVLEPHRVSWAELKEDLHRRKAFPRTARMSEGKFVKFAHLLGPVSKRTSAKKYLVPHTWYLTYKYQVLLLCTRFVFQGATVCGPLLVGNFLSAGLGSSPIYSSLISVCKA